jgi:hypothetical protein
MSSIPPSTMPEEMRTRPERRFERRRGLYLTVIILGVAFVGAFVLDRCSHPMGGVNEFLSSPARAQGGPSPTAVRGGLPVVVTLAPMTSTPARKGVQGDMLHCYAQTEIRSGEYTYPQGALMIATGYTGARGGMVLIDGEWITIASVRCEGDVSILEIPYRVIPTQTPRAAQAAPKVVVITTTPGPVQPATIVNTGTYIDASGCLVIAFEGVREIWVDGQGVSNGRYCLWHEVKVIR